MSVTKGPAGAWRVDVEATTPTGQLVRVRRQSGKWTRRDAEQWERETRRQIEHGTWGKEPEPQRQVPTLGDYLPTYLDEITVGPNTLETKKGYHRKWLARFANRRLDTFVTGDFTALRTTLLKAGRKPKTANNVLTELATVVRHWHRQQDLPPPQFRVGLVKLDQTRPGWYSEADFELLVEAAATVGAEHLAVILLAGDAGLRKSEIRALRWSDFDLGERCTVDVQRSRDNKNTQDIPTKGKRARIVPLTPRLADAIRGLPKRGFYVFVRDDEPLTHRMVASLIKQVERQADFPMTGRCHVFRHSFCTHLAHRDGRPVVIQALAGHQDLGTTQRYMHVARSALDEAIAALGRANTARQHSGNFLSPDAKKGS